MRFPEFSLALPGWVEDVVAAHGDAYMSIEERMSLTIELARRNVREQSGGPFGAAIFELSSGTLLAPGVNMVVPSHCSVAHAEMVAILIAQRMVRNHDLGAPGFPAYQLVSSTEPCAMCMGAIPWSGVRSLVCGARDEDARQVGFDEGPKVSQWRRELELRGISVETDVLRAQAVAVLNEYVEGGAWVYNARQGTLKGSQR